MTAALKEEGGPCPRCKEAVEIEWVDDRVPVSWPGRGTVEVTVRVPLRRCGACGFEFLNHEAICRHMGILTPRDVREIWALLGTTREDLCRLTGIPEKTFDRYLEGIEYVTPSHDRFLKVLRSSDDAFTQLRRVVEGWG